MTSYTQIWGIRGNFFRPFIISDNRAEAVEYAKDLGIKTIRSIGECPCGCGMKRYKIVEYEMIGFKPN